MDISKLRPEHQQTIRNLQYLQAPQEKIQEVYDRCLPLAELSDNEFESAVVVETESDSEVIAQD